MGKRKIISARGQQDNIAQSLTRCCSKNTLSRTTACAQLVNPPLHAETRSYAVWRLLKGAHEIMQ